MDNHENDNILNPQELTYFIPARRRVRAVFGGQTIADSRRAMLYKEPRHAPLYFFPQDDVQMTALSPVDTRPEGKLAGEAFYLSPPLRSKAAYWNLTAGGKTAQQAALTYPEPMPSGADLRGYVAFQVDKIDHWYEEAEEVFGHPRDPYHRVDVLQSDREIRIMVGGQVIAETKRPMLLLETSLPPRYYIPQEDVRMDLLTPTQTHTRCPYKGLASYWSATINGQTIDDIVWSYLDPLPDAAKIKGLLSFYDERVEAVYIDGELQTPPRTFWSNTK
ncbi:MAG: DUF427 domain-containing protein [bacterium]|nr:DUF427 domain-containing protein [bacterium]